MLSLNYNLIYTTTFNKSKQKLILGLRLSVALLSWIGQFDKIFSNGHIFWLNLLNTFEFKKRNAFTEKQFHFLPNGQLHLQNSYLPLTKAPTKQKVPGISLGSKSRCFRQMAIRNRHKKLRRLTWPPCYSTVKHSQLYSCLIKLQWT